MPQQEAIKLFEQAKIRTVWDEDQEKWFFSIIDVIAVLTESENPRKYWSVLKTRLKNEGSEMATNCSQLKLQAADGKRYLTDVADTEQVLRLIKTGREVVSPLSAKRFFEGQEPKLELEDKEED